MRSRRAFSLVEAMLTLFIVFLIFGVAAQLLMGYAGVMKSSAGKSDTLSSLQVGMQVMIDDLRQATQVLSPPAGGSSLDLRFSKIDPTLNWLPGPVPGSWSPLAASNLVDVRYYLDTGRLLRVAGASTWQVADGLGGLQFEDQVHGIQIQMSLRESQRTLVVTGFSGKTHF